MMNIAIVHYPFALKSSVYGLYELFEMAGRICIDQEGSDRGLNCQILKLEELSSSLNYDLVILPPALEDQFYRSPDEHLLRWLVFQRHGGAVLCSACAGAFILASAGVLQKKRVTTHWGLSEQFSAAFPDITIDTNSILINEGDIITAGGLMSWLDLGLELVQNYLGPSVMSQLGKNLVVDTGYREQSYYRQFIPKRNHGDELVIRVQQYLDNHFADNIQISKLALFFHVSERTLLRRFKSSTSYKPLEYIQYLRIQKACDLLEKTKLSFDSISLKIGYEDSSACRKLFVRRIGLTPKEFRQRFVKAGCSN